MAWEAPGPDGAECSGADGVSVMANEALVIGEGRGGRRPPRLTIEVVRELTDEDLPGLTSRLPVGASAHKLHQIRHSHHLLARCLANGHSIAEASLITGYGPTYISSLKNDPAFDELVSHYETNKELVMVDVMERLRALGLNTVEELQRRLDEDPDKFKNRELMELAEMALVKTRQPGVGGSGQAGSGPAGAVPPVSIEVNFVNAREAPARIVPAVDLLPIRDLGEDGRG